MDGEARCGACMCESVPRIKAEVCMPEHACVANWISAIVSFVMLRSCPRVECSIPAPFESSVNVPENEKWP